MKITTGTYSSANQESNSVVANLIKYPEIAKTLIDLYPRYTLTYLLEKAGRGAREKVLGNNSFEWKVMGRYSRPATLKTARTNATATAVGSTTANGEFIFEDTTAEPCALQVNDKVRFPDGKRAIVKAVDKTTNAGQADVDFVMLDAIAGTEDYAVNDVFGVIGTAFSEGSLGSAVGQNLVYPDTYKNWLTTHRRKSVITGSALTDVTWIENNGHRLWYFTAEDIKEKQFMYEMELQRWYGKASYAASSADDFPGDNGDTLVNDAALGGEIVTGDGILEQIDAVNQATYAGGSLTEAIITEFIAKLALSSQMPEGNEYVVFTGMEGKVAFHQAMKDLIVANGAGGGTIFDASAGQEIELGGNFTTYYALGNKITLAYCPVFDDPNVHSATMSGGGAANDAFGSARKKESAKMVFMDFGSTSGVSNVELIAKGAEGINRNYIKKYVPGMVNPFDSGSMMAASGDDNFECHLLSESGIIVRNPLSCGILSVA